MAAESIITLKKPGFPKISNSENGTETVIEYIGAFATLEPAEPARNSTWGDYDGRVKSTNLTPVENSTYGELTVVVEDVYEASTAGTAQEISTEIDWVLFQRSMLEHPVFRIGGGGRHALTIMDVVDIENWRNEPDPDLKSVYKYLGGTPEYKIEQSLSANASKFADAINLGLETYEDYAPVARKTTTYTNGPPPSTNAGTLETPTGITGLPAGYEWRKTADRSIRAGKNTKWDRDEEWTGAIKVLTTRNEIYF